MLATKPSKAMLIRRLSTVASLGVAGYAGFMKRPLVMIPLLAVVFTAIFIMNKWSMIRLAKSMGGQKTMVKMGAAAYMAQLFFVALVFFFGRMLGAIFQDYGKPIALIQNDWMLLGGLLAFGALVAGIANRVQGQNAGGDMMAQMQQMMAQMTGGAGGAAANDGGNPFADMMRQMQEGQMRDVTPDAKEKSKSKSKSAPKNSLRGKPKNLN